MKTCTSDRVQECTDSSYDVSRNCAEMKTGDSAPLSEPTSGSNELETGSPLECTCETCEAGAPAPMEEGLQHPLHAKIHEQVCAALKRGEIHVRGETE